MRKIRTKNYRLSLAKHCFVVKEGALVDLLSKSYGRKIALKIFDLEHIKKPEDIYTAKWGDDPPPGEPRKNTKFWSACQIQNICSWNQLAPRIYGVETVSIADKLVPVQIIEFVEETEPTNNDKAYEVYKKVIALGNKIGFRVDKEDVSDKDVINNQHLIDFQTFEFTEPYQEIAKHIYIQDGRYGKVYYQDVPEIGMGGGPRKSEQRIKELGLDQIDFNGKVVWDIGCAGGFFCRYAESQGAKRVLGFDTPETINAARHISNYLGYFNIDYHPVDLSKQDLFGYSELKPDIVFFLSMNFHIGIPEWMRLAETVIFEDNGKKTRHGTELYKPWTQWFSNWIHYGKATDHGDKSIYHITK